MSHPDADQANQQHEQKLLGRNRLLLCLLGFMRYDRCLLLVAVPARAEPANEPLCNGTRKHAAKYQSCGCRRHPEFHGAANILDVRKTARVGRGRSVPSDQRDRAGHQANQGMQIQQQRHAEPDGFLHEHQQHEKPEQNDQFPAPARQRSDISGQPQGSKERQQQGGFH